ncbi:hypothetical protein A4X06_0g5491 [Tilletia controversa]|uniref:Uncharacterized protein n=5 Tax=Tilletia TaxID=13289 RepID=A0A8X7MQI1_9BASI|nr:hypothetical protein CF328_g3241 [Tilletia controversa]KAE8245684.1 hypothetical protein A4X06_0g5491 [Tilletia controversa]
MVTNGSQPKRLSRKPKSSVVRKGTVRILADGSTSHAVISTRPLSSTHIYSHHDLGDFPNDYSATDDYFNGDGGADTDGADTSGADASDLLFYRRQTVIVNISQVHANPLSWRQREQNAFEDWVTRLDDLVAPYLAATRSTLPSRTTWAHMLCTCSSPPTSAVLFVDLHGATPLRIRSCKPHLAELLVRGGTIPSTVHAPQVTFSNDYIRLFLALQDNARIGAFNFTLASSQASSLGTSAVPPSAIWTSRDTGRRTLRSASEWMQALEQRCHQLILGTGILWNHSRPQLAEDDLETSPGPPNPRDSSDLRPEVVVCLDGNFQHKRIRCNDAVKKMPKAPTFFLSPRQLNAARERFENPDIPEGPRTGCSAEVRAAIDGTVKTTQVDFDIGGVVGMTCRHGSPLILVDVESSGKKHYYAYALLEALLDTCSSYLSSLGVCYDIGCKLAVSPRLEAALSKRGHSIPLHHVVSIFHVYGHDYDCQLKYSPRRTAGFGLTDGEALERLWSALSDLVSLTRHMSAADRLSTLSSRLGYLSSKHRQDLLHTMQRQLVRISKLQQTETRQFLQALPYLVQYTNESVARAYASTSPETGLPARLTAFINTQLARRRALAFDKDATSRQLALREQHNRRNRVVDLSVEAKRLYLPLKSWHALSAIIRGRHAQHSHDGTTRLTISKTSSAMQAKLALPALNASIERYRTALPERLRHRLHLVSTDALFLPANLPYIHGLLNPADVDEEPWVVDSVLAAAMDTVELLNRLNEETSRISEEISNMGKWYEVVQNSLQDSLSLYVNPESSLFDRDRAAFVAQQVDTIRCMFRVWKARLDNISQWHQSHLASLMNQRASHSKRDHIARFDRLVEQHSALAVSWLDWPNADVFLAHTGSPHHDGGRHTPGNDVDADEDAVARALVEDEDEEDEAGESGAQRHPLDRTNYAHDAVAVNSGDEDEDDDDVDERLSALLSGILDVGSSDELSASANVAETDGVDASKRHTANNKKAVNKKAVGACNTRPRLPTKWKLAASDFLDDPAALAAATRAVPAAAAVAAKHSTPDLSSQQIQQILAHQHQVAAQAQSVIYNPSHMSSIVGPFNGSSSYMGVWRWGLRTRPRPLAMVVGSHFPTAQSPTSSIVLPAGGMTMSGRANALAVAGLRRPGIIPMQQPSMRSQPQQMLPHGVSPFTSSSQMVSFQQQQQPQQRMYSMPMGMDPLAREGSMGMGVPMDTPSSTGGPGSILSASLLDVYSQQNCGVGGHHHHLHPHRPSMSGHSVSDFSGLNALGETRTTATSVELSSNGEESGLGSQRPIFSGPGSPTWRVLGRGVDEGAQAAGGRFGYCASEGGCSNSSISIMRSSSVCSRMVGSVTWSLVGSDRLLGMCCHSARSLHLTQQGLLCSA